VAGAASFNGIEGAASHRCSSVRLRQRGGISSSTSKFHFGTPPPSISAPCSLSTPLHALPPQAHDTGLQQTFDIIRLHPPLQVRDICVASSLLIMNQMPDPHVTPGPPVGPFTSPPSPNRFDFSTTLDPPAALTLSSCQSKPATTAYPAAANRPH
jgi:hypothetical protein